MSRIGLVGYCNNSGIGRECVDVAHQLPIASWFVVDHKVKGLRRDLLRGHYAVSSPAPTTAEMVRWIDDARPDTVLTFEVPFNWEYPELWRKKGIRWICVVHVDWFPSQLTCWKYLSKMIVPSTYASRLVRGRGHAAEVLAVPIDTRQFWPRRIERFNRALFVNGYGGMEDRRGIPQVIQAYQNMNPKPQLVIKSQVDVPAARAAGIPLDVSNPDDPHRLYEVGDFLIATTRYEGVGISLYEAMACGLPVLTTDAGPMDELVPWPEWRIPVQRTVEVLNMGQKVTSYIVDPMALAKRWNELNDQDAGRWSAKVRDHVERNLSWDALRDRWRAALGA